MANTNDAKKPDIAALEKSIQEKSQKLESDKIDLTKQQSISSSRSEAEWWSATNAMTISSVVLIFGLVIMVLATYLLQKGKNADEVLKLFGTIIIIISSVFLVVAGYTDTQIAPVMGLLGTIAGYLLGRKSADESKTTETKPVDNTSK
jgi:ABC-type multidrug transport system fused ATPase/permease subunit